MGVPLNKNYIWEKLVILLHIMFSRDLKASFRKFKRKMQVLGVTILRICARDSLRLINKVQKTVDKETINQGEHITHLGLSFVNELGQEGERERESQIHSLWLDIKQGQGRR